MIRPVRGRGQFARIQQGKTAHGQFCWIRGLPADDDHTHIAYAISKRYGSAVRRNRIRRRFRAVCEQIEREEGLPRGIFLVGPTRSTSDAEFGALIADVRTAFAHHNGRPQER